jgi:hypothetical protein
VTPELALASLAQAIFFCVLGWCAGRWLVTSLQRRDSEEDVELDWPEAALVGGAGFVAAAVLLMVANIVLGGVVFGVPGVVPVGALALLVLRRRDLGLLRRVPWGRLALFLVGLALVWTVPSLLSGTAARSGDTPWHLGWTEQLLAGEPVPEGPAPAEVAENAYPWGFHAVLATLVRLVPGSDVMSALLALQIVLMAYIPLAAACLARRLRPEAGWAAAGATAFVGGFGWLLARGPAFVTSPPRARFGADLVVASPNAVYGLFPPPLPRELGLVLLAAAGVLLALGLSKRSNPLLLTAGALLGCAGLVSVPALVAGIAWTVAAVLLASSGRRIASLLRVLAPAALVFALWAGPVLSGMIAHGGLVNVSPSLGREWPLWTALASWGLLVPLVLLGAARARRLGSARVVGAFGLATAGLLGLALARGAFEWALAGNATVLHQGRIWPIAHLLGGAVAGVGLWSLVDWLEERRSRTGATAVIGLLGIGLVSPVFASISLSETMIEMKRGYHYRRADLDEGSFLRRAAERLDPDDTVIVRGDSPEANALAFHLFSFSGVRLADYDDPRLESNDLRIRYRDLAEAWNEQVREGRFPADYVVEPLPEPATNEAIETPGLTGDFAGRQWLFTQSG